MRMLWVAALTALLATTARAAGPPAAIYDKNPEHLWNRLHKAIAVRTADGVAYGVDNAEPFREPFDDPGKLENLLDEFLAQHGENRATDPLRRALFQNDLWAAFDLAASWVYDTRNLPQQGRDGAPLRIRLARVLKRLTLSPTGISGLPDNYQQAVRSGKFAIDFDPAHPERAFLPPDLFDPHGPWVQIGNELGEPEALLHTQMFSGRSAFSVFIRCPAGREATQTYLRKLNLYPTPWALNPNDIAIEYPDKAQVRESPLRLDPRTPQFPPGTIVALVRRLMVIDDQLEPQLTQITQAVQFRVYLEVGVASNAAASTGRQQPFEFVMRRTALLAGNDGGLHAMEAHEAEYKLLPMFEGARGAVLKGPVVLSQCQSCHVGDGIFSVNSYTRRLTRPATNPRFLPLGEPPLTDGGLNQGLRTAEWKEKQHDWGLLQGLIEASSNPED